MARIDLYTSINPPYKALMSIKFLNDLTQQQVKSLLRYDPETGEWNWLVFKKNRKTASTKAGSLIKKTGYVCICINGHLYQAHRLAWLYMTGYWPTNQVDHKDTNRSNNKWDNLRLASNSLNQANTKNYRNNTSGHKGIWFRNDCRKWYVKVGRKYVGLFETYDDAVNAYQKTAAEKYGEYARSGELAKRC
jgi:hypothetical protein